MAIFSISDQFTNYYEYHQNKVNQIIHFIFVPVLTFSVIMVFFSVKLPFLQPVIDALPFKFFEANLAFIAFAILIPYYLILSFIPGFILTVEFLLMHVYVSKFYYAWTPEQYWLAFGVISLVGWGTQFCGHAYEGRRPALFDNLFQVFIAPLFVLLEALFVLGYAPELKKSVEAKLQARNNNKKKN